MQNWNQWQLSAGAVTTPMPQPPLGYAAAAASATDSTTSMQSYMQYYNQPVSIYNFMCTISYIWNIFVYLYGGISIFFYILSHINIQDVLKLNIKTSGTCGESIN